MEITAYPREAFTCKIHRFRRVVEATQFIKEQNLDTNTTGTLPIFGVDATTKSAAKKYMVGGWDPLWGHIERMTRMNKAHFYEMLQEGVPTRLFFDLDVVAPCATFEADMGAVIESVRTLVRTSDPEFEVEDPMILDSSNATKHSRHLVYPNLVMPSMEAVKTLVRAVIADLQEKHPDRASQGDHILGIDPAVYTKGRLFRVLGSSKKNKTPHTPFRLVGSEEGFTPKVFFKTLVTPYRTATYGNPVLDAIPVIERLWAPRVEEPEKSDVPTPKRTKLRHSPCPMPETVVFTDDEWNAVVDRCQRWLMRRHPTIETFYPVRQGDTLEFILSPGVPCPKNGNVAHRSNKTWFKVNLRNYWGRYTCCDPACSHHSWGKQKYRDMIVNPFKK